MIGPGFLDALFPVGIGARGKMLSDGHEKHVKVRQIEAYEDPVNSTWFSGLALLRCRDCLSRWSRRLCYLLAVIGGLFLVCSLRDSIIL